MGESPAADLRARIRRHLEAYPRLTAHEVARALGAAKSSVQRRLLAMEADGEAAREVTPKGPGTRGAVTTWSATGQDSRIADTGAATAAGERNSE